VSRTAATATTTTTAATANSQRHRRSPDGPPPGGVARPAPGADGPSSNGPETSTRDVAGRLSSSLVEECDAAGMAGSRVVGS
jgi:hypothetical protein